MPVTQSCEMGGWLLSGKRVVVPLGSAVFQQLPTNVRQSCRHAQIATGFFLKRGAAIRQLFQQPFQGSPRSLPMRLIGVCR